MNKLFSIKWTQPYPTPNLRPFLRSQMEELESIIESQLETSDFKEANELIRRVKNASTS